MSSSARLFRYLEAKFCAGLLDDPVLLVRVRPLGRNLLFDCGQIHHLAKRVLKQTQAIFISHAHMDHFMGIDTFIRNVLVSPGTFEIFGPPGLAVKLQHKLAGYDWNLAERFWCSLRVREVHAESIVSWLFPGPKGFPCLYEGEQRREGRIVYRNDYLQVEAVLCDHKIPVVAYCCRERPIFSVDRQRLQHAGLVAGPWLEELKRRFYNGFIDRTPLKVLRRFSDDITPGSEPDAESLYRSICRSVSPASIGYVSDIGFSPENLIRLNPLLKDVFLLIAECAFLSEDIAKARRSYHLCTQDLNRLLDDLRPGYFLPMHLSKTYNGRCQVLYQELQMPPEVSLIQIPEHLLPRPLLPCDFPRLPPKLKSIPGTFH
ncbi:ribonuclease Z [Syntrophotalea acetylenivorans]|uniref:Ribonuclease Z n=1 Tax=Syntrophotalea acetylenivorans TaxID=1842532 RepID=A0A1L3GLI9_9BACT|nr:MBL fold metallo-hydrolase [Syntrophotalea acetylenivorans]APG26528.1 ribonuclease Z [Syntrophotalea acetylenivorans]